MQARKLSSRSKYVTYNHTPIFTSWNTYQHLDQVRNHLPSPVPTRKYLLEVLEAPIKVAVLELFKQGINKKRTAEQLGITRQWIGRHLPEAIPLRQVNDEQIVLKYLQLLSIEKTRKESGISWAATKKILLKFRIKIRKDHEVTKIIKHKQSDFDLPISVYLHEVISGALLGDLNIDIVDSYLNQFSNTNFQIYHKSIHFLRSTNHFNETQVSPECIDSFNKANAAIVNSACARLRYHKSLLEEPWLRTLQQLFFQEGLKTKFNLSRNQETNKLTCYLDTMSRVIFYDLYRKWYPNNKKILPKNLILTPNTILHWFIGDGNQSGYRVHLSSYNFSQSENLLLKQLLKRDLNINSFVRPSYDKRNGQTYYYIDISGRENINGFFEYMNKADTKTLKLAKEIFNWKFDRFRKKPNYTAIKP